MVSMIVRLEKRFSSWQALGCLSSIDRLDRRLKKVYPHSTHEVEIKYVNISATVVSDMIAFRATAEPMLTRDSSKLMAQVSRMALTGTRSVGWTFDIQPENGNPLSLAKAKACREVATLKVILDAMASTRTPTVSAVVAPGGMALRKT